MHQFTPAWPEFFARLRRFNLAHLDLQIQAHSPAAPGIAALSSVTQLTALSLRGWSCLATAADWQAFACMTALQRLRLNRGDVYFAVPPDCLASMRSLGALTALTLLTSKADKPLVLHLVEKLATESLPALQELTLSLYDPYLEDRLMASHAALLPSLRRLTAVMETAGSSAESFHDSHFRSAAREHHCAAAQRLSRGAASAGLKLAIK